MREALKEARYAYEDNEIPIGAVIVCQNKIIARAHNLTERLTDVTAHAEMQAFTSAANYLGGKYLEECILYVTVEPCVMCAGASYWTQLDKIVYGARDEKKGFLLISPQESVSNDAESLQTKKILHPKTKLVGGVLEKECSELIVEFFRKMREG